MMKVGIVGLPNAGKSTLFNALTQGGAQTGDYPFTTIDPNIAVVTVPDQRLEKVAATIASSKVVLETIEFHDIAGLVPGAAEGEGLGNRFLGAIRETDAICHVVRAHQSSEVPHPEGRIDPVNDLELIETELCAADLETAASRLDRVTKQARALDPEAIAEKAWLEDVVAALSAGRPVRSVPLPDAAGDADRRLQALTSKPMLYVANIDEGEVAVPSEIAVHAAAANAAVVAISARIEMELAELDEAEAAELRGELDLAESGLERLIGAAWELLDLISFFTAGEAKEAMARSLKRGTTAHGAAAKIHTDIADGFVKAEVIGWEALVEHGGYSAARDAGKLRIEGRDYLMADGDVITIKHT